MSHIIIFSICHIIYLRIAIHSRTISRASTFVGTHVRTLVVPIYLSISGRREAGGGRREAEAGGGRREAGGGRREAGGGRREAGGGRREAGGGRREAGGGRREAGGGRREAGGGRREAGGRESLTVHGVWRAPSNGHHLFISVHAPLNMRMMLHTMYAPGAAQHCV